MSEALDILPAEPLETAFDAQDLKRRSVHGSLLTMGAQGCKMVLKFGSAIVVARLLSPAEFGLVAMVSPILGFLSTFNDLGFGQAIVQTPSLYPRALSALFWRNLLVSCGLALLLAAISPLVGHLYHEPRTTGILVALGLALVLTTLGLVPSALLKREMRFGPLAIMDVGSMIIASLVTIGTALAGFGYWSLVIGQLSSSLAGMTMAFLFTRWWPSFYFTDEKLSEYFRFGANLTLVNVATYFSMTADNIIVGAVAGKVQLGLYDRSYNLTLQPLNQLLSPINQVSVPLLSRLQDKEELFRSSYRHMLRMAMTLTMPAMLFCVLLAQPLLDVLLGPKWHAAAPIFAWVCFGGIIAPLFSSTGWVFTTQNRTGEQMRFSIATALISIVSFALGVHWGARGVAAVSAISFTFIQVPLMVYVMTRRGVVRVADVAGTLTPFFMADALVAVPLFLLRHSTGLPALVGIGALTYVLFIGCLLLLPGRREFLNMLLSLRSTLQRRA